MLERLVLHGTDAFPFRCPICCLRDDIWFILAINPERGDEDLVLVRVPKWRI
ncbi:hypothetical protein KFK09_005830 [Dendrobium nobile]|uniref:Uncharacterized protein n=1 Tax=Dendrobium nobile TaxID=94219 RepID=A0A8T3C266_DENNO|nr:hypothetical protein KFK09_005830 [Dendrobium nobile]